MTDRIGWTVVHTCSDGRITDLYWQRKRSNGLPWLVCPRCTAAVRLIARHPNGKVVDRFDDGRDYLGQDEQASDSTQRVSSEP